MVKIMGSCSGSSGSKYDLWLEVTQNSQSVANNSSNLTVAMKLKRNDGFSDSAFNSDAVNRVKLSVAGVEKINRLQAIDTRYGTTVTLASWTGDVLHGEDGTLTVALSGSFDMTGTSLDKGSVSGSFKCTTIARASSLTIGATSVTPGGNFDVGISGSKSFTHKIVCQIGSNEKLTTNFAKGVLSGNITIPEDWASFITNAKSGTIKVTLYTYSGSNKIGSKSYNLKFSIPEKYKPTFKVVLSGDETESGYYLPGVNQLKVALSNIVFYQGAQLKSISIKFNGVTITENNAVFEIIDTGVAVQSVTARVTDSRGYYTESVLKINVKSYSPPSVHISKIERCDENGNSQFDGRYLKVAYKTSEYSKDGEFFPKFKWRDVKSDDYNEVHWSASDTPSPAIIGNGLIEPEKSYFVMITLSDGISEGFDTRKIGNAKLPFNIKKGGTGAAFGGYAETDNELTVYYNLQVKGNIVYKDITDNAVINSEYFEDLRTEIRHYPCLDMTFIHLRATVKKAIPADTTITVITVSEDTELGNNPNIAHPLSVCTNTATLNKGVNAYMTYYGEIKFSTGQQIAVGKRIYIKDFWLTTGSEEEEF